MENEQLVALVKAGEDIADNMFMLWQQNKGMVYKTARKYSSMADIEDLQQEGYIALCRAVDCYDPEYGVKFISYAARIIDQKLMIYANKNRLVRMPGEEQHRIALYYKTVNAYRTHLGRKPTDSEIAATMGVSDKIVRQIQKDINMSRMASLDAPLNVDDNETVSLMDMLEDERDDMRAVEQDIENEELKAVLWGTVDSLPEEQSVILHAVYQQGKTLQSIGKEMKITEAKVYCTHRAGLRALRYGSRGKALLPFYDGYVRNMAMHGVGVGTFNRTWTSATERVALKMM